ncbi:sialate O-acetylesterase [soil metagenome]
MKSHIQKSIKNCSLVCVAIFCIQLAEAKVILPSVFSDNMVLQQKTNAAIWGTTGVGKTVSIITGWNNKKYTVTANKDGAWKVKVLTPSFGGPYTISINDGELTTLKNVLIGEVWVCSGQSNMEMPLAGWGKIQDYEKEIAEANYPDIRLLQAEHITSNKPLDDATVTNGGWTVCSPQYVAGFSSVAYFFAREIYRKTKIPVGLIHTSWGGTIAEAWTSGTTLKTMADFSDAVTTIEQAGAGDSKEAYDEKLKAWQKNVDVKDAGYSNGEPAWAINTPDTAGWQTMVLPTLWENASLPDFDGIVWFRKKIMVPASWAGADIQVTLGAIDDDDITWFNGEKIGATQGYNKPRIYTIPGSLVKEGNNEITVRVFDGAGGGGMYDDAKLLSLTAAKGEQISLAGPWMYKVGLNLKDMPARPAEINGPNRPTVLYNAMIHPFIQYSIRGAIWYQGESNADRAFQYRSLFPAMIKDWRQHWNEGDFPFYFVQLANFMKAADKPGESAWAELREAQLKTLSLPNMGMASAIDIGNAEDIHPKNKQEVGRRLALIALAKTYGQKISYSGPLYQSYKVEQNKIRLTFTNVDAGLKTKNDDSLAGFEIAGADKKFYWATATIAGNQVIVSSPDVANPVSVRYAWANNPAVNLYNGAGLPASPFRTDDWHGVTYGKK